MIPRGQLDLSHQDLLRACGLGIPDEIPDEIASRQTLASAFPAEGRETLPSLSVRSAWDALLATSNWPSGSEVLCSAVNVPEMFALIEHHDYRPVPLDVDRRTLTVDPAEIRQRATRHTRAILVASLFGSRVDLTPIASIVRETGLAVIEDLAQAFAGDGHGGDDLADVSLFSFGLIKSHTALGGAVVRIQDREWAERCRRQMSGWPRRTGGEFRRRAWRSLALRCVTWPPLYTALRFTLELLGQDWEAGLSPYTRGFTGGPWPERLRRQPGHRELAFLAYRLGHPDRRWFDQRRHLGERYREELPEAVRVGDAAMFPSRWVCPVVSRHPAALVQDLLSDGYDATTRASQLAPLLPSPVPPETRVNGTAAWYSRLVYLPLHPALQTTDIERIAAIVSRRER